MAVGLFAQFSRGLRSLFQKQAGQILSLINLPTTGATGPASIREGCAHWLVFRCLQKLVDAASDCQPIVERRRGTEWRVIPEHPLFTLLRRPNSVQTWPDFCCSLLIDEHTFGRVYVEVLRGRSDEVIGFLPLDPRAVIEVGEKGRADWGLFEWGADGYGIGRIISYEVNDGFGHRVLSPDDVIAVHLFDQRSIMFGLSPVRVALQAVGLENSLARYASTYLRNGGPSALLSIKNRALDEEQAEAIRAAWARRYAFGGSREGQIAVIDEDATYQQIGSHLDSLANDILAQQDQAAICGALGVPAILSGALVGLRWANQRAGQAGAMKDFWLNKISPTMTRWRYIFDYKLLPLFEDESDIAIRIRCGWDLSEVWALREDNEVKANRLRLDYGAGIIMLNEARTMQNLPPIDGGDRFKDGSAPGDQQQGANGGERLLGSWLIGRGISLSDMQVIQKLLAQGRTRATGGLLNAAHLLQPSVLRSYDWEGMRLGRKPTVEEEKRLKGWASAQDQAREVVTPSILKARVSLIRDAEHQLQKMEGNFQELALHPSEAHQRDVTSAVEAGFAAGAASAAAEDHRKVGFLDPEDSYFKRAVSRITEAALIALATAVGARFVSALQRRLLREEPMEQALAAAEEEMLSESTSYAEAIAVGAAYQSVADGRYDHFQQTDEFQDRYVYSAILDSNVCEVCAAVDGRESYNLDDLPLVPNPDCQGGYRCRCTIFRIFGTEGGQ
jgi:HK97 family phage portal protein